MMNSGKEANSIGIRGVDREEEDGDSEAGVDREEVDGEADWSIESLERGEVEIEGDRELDEEVEGESNSNVRGRDKEDRSKVALFLI
jgi:hypothetical protein